MRGTRSGASTGVSPFSLRLSRVVKGTELSSLPLSIVWWLVTILGCVAVGLIAYYRDTIVEKVSPLIPDTLCAKVSLNVLLCALVRTPQGRHCQLSSFVHLSRLDPHHPIVSSIGRSRDRLARRRVDLGSLDRFRDRLRGNLDRRNALFLLVQVSVEQESTRVSDFLASSL